MDGEALSGLPVMRYQTQNFTLDTDDYSLKRNGINHAIEPQVFDLLVYLIENRNRVVARDELLDKLWNGRIVSDSAINARLKAARKAVGDNGKQQKVIKTIHRRGYQFIADVVATFDEAQTVETNASQHLAKPDKPSIAVLPFEYLSNEDDREYFAQGLTQDINAGLCRYRELFVIDSKSAFMFTASATSNEDFARQLGVDYVASGSIRHDSKRIKISVQLVEIASGKIIWSETVDREAVDLFVLEDEIAIKIASSLARHIEDESIARAMHKPSESMTAYDCALRARQIEDSCESESIAAARILLERAVELDANYAAAYAHLASTYIVEYENEWCTSRDEALRLAVDHARKALALDEYDAFAHGVIGTAYLYQHRFDLSELHLDRAIECNPNDYSAYCTKTWLVGLTGRASEVNICGTRALQLNPLAPDLCIMAITTAHYARGDYEASLETLERIVDPSEASEALRAASLAQLGRTNEAKRAAANAVDLGGDFLQHEDWLLYWPFKYPRDREHFLEGLYKAGVLANPSVAAKKPSVAVVRFSNLSNDSGQQYFSDGMSVNICSRLCRIRSLLVKSAVEYDPGNKSLSEISRELEVDYVLGGSVQREGEQVRVFVELTDGGSGQIKWSEHFDRRGNDVIGIQDEIAAAITGTLWNVRGTIREAERDKLLTKPPSDFNAFDYILKGIHYKEEYTAKSIGSARECFERAISLDPNSTEGYAWLAWMHLFEIELGSATDKADLLKQAIAAAKKSISIGSNSLLGHWALGHAYAMDQDVSRGLVELERALEINPDDPDLMITKGALLSYLGRLDEGIEQIQRGIEFNKQIPDWYFWDLGKAYFAGHKWQDAIEAFLRMQNQNKETLVFLVACYMQTGNIAKAEGTMDELLGIDPATRPEEIEESYSYLTAGTRRLLADSFKAMFSKRQPQEILRVVKI